MSVSWVKMGIVSSYRPYLLSEVAGDSKKVHLWRQFHIFFVDILDTNSHVIIGKTGTTPNLRLFLPSNFKLPVSLGSRFEDIVLILEYSPSLRVAFLFHKTLDLRLSHSSFCKHDRLGSCQQDSIVQSGYREPTTESPFATILIRVVCHCDSTLRGIPRQSTKWSR